MMKKLFILSMLVLGTTSAFAFSFRTTCGKIVSMDVGGMSNSAIQAACSQMNYIKCGVFPGSVTVYY